MYRTLAILSTVIALMLVYTAPLSAESTTAPETSAITQDDINAAYQAGKADAEDGYDLVFEDGYYAALEDAAYDGPCNAMDVSSDDIPAYRIDQLKAAGYTADPNDGKEALYPPNC